MDKSKLYASNIADNWDELPQTLKLVASTPKVSFNVSEKDKNFIELFKPFLGKDEFRESMMGIHFDEKCVVATNAHILVTYPNSSTYRGYLLVETSEKFPNYSAVIPKDLPYVRKFNVTKLRTYIKSIIAGRYSNQVTFATIFKIGDLKFGMNVKFLDTILSFFQKIGEENIYIGGRGQSSAFVFCADKSFDFEKNPLALCMPIFIDDESNYGAYDVDLDKEASYYFDFTDGEIHNKDGSVATFDSTLKQPTKTAFNLSFSSIIKKLSSSKFIEILNYVCVKDGMLSATNLSQTIKCKVSEQVPNGIYDFVSDTLISQNLDIDDFPKEVTEFTDKFILGKEAFETFAYALKIEGDDEFRPVFMTVNFNVSENRVRLSSTDAVRMIVNTFNCDSSSSFDSTIESENLLPYIEATKGQDYEISIGKRFMVKTDESIFFGKSFDGKYVNCTKVIDDTNDRITSKGATSVFFSKKELLAVMSSNKFKKNEYVNFVVSENMPNTLEVYVSTKDESKKIGEIYGGVKEIPNKLIETGKANILMPFIMEEVKSDFAFNNKFLKEYLATFTSDSVELISVKDGVSPYFMDFNDTIFAQSTTIKKASKKKESVAEEPVLKKPKKSRPLKVKAEKPKPVEVEKPKMDEKYRILLNTELPEYMISSINELGKKTNGFTDFDDRTKAGTDKLVELVNEYISKKEKEVSVPQDAVSNKEKIKKAIASIKLSIKYLSGDSKTKQQAILKRLNLALKYLK